MNRPIPGPYTVDYAKAAISSPSGIVCMFTEWGDADQATARVMVSALNAEAQVARLEATVTEAEVERAGKEIYDALWGYLNADWSKEADACRDGYRKAARAVLVDFHTTRVAECQP